MNFLRKIFCKPVPRVYTGNVFPGERYTDLKVFLPDGPGFATVNKAYDHYPNKKLFPWVVLVEIQILTKNHTRQPTEPETRKLLNIEKKIGKMLQERHTVHKVASVNRIGFRDVLMYIDSPKITQSEVDKFFSQLSNGREINFDLKRDPEWLAVKSFVE